MPLSAGGANSVAPAQNIVPFISYSTSEMPDNMVNQTVSKALNFSDTNPVLIDWSNIHKIVYFGGSESEGQVLIPTPGWISTAHKHGVKIYGTLFISPGAYSGTLETSQLSYLLESPYQEAKVLAKIAVNYGFDGYFLNEEETENSQIVGKFIPFIRALKQDYAQDTGGRQLGVEWYMVGVLDNNILENPAKSGTADQMVATSTFADYGLWQYEESDPFSQAFSQGYQPSRVELGIDAASGQQSMWLTEAFKVHSDISIAEFAFGAILKNGNFSSNTLNQQDQRSVGFWGLANSLSKAQTGHVLPVQTWPYSYPFSTNFNTGKGNDFYINGQATHFGLWYQVSLQSWLPSENLLSDQSSPNDSVGYDYSDVFNGGSSYSINLANSNGQSSTQVTLFPHLSLKIPNSGVPTLSVTYQLVSGNGVLSVCLDAQGSSQPTCLPLNGQHAAIQTGWITQSVSLSAVSGKTIQDITLQLSGKGKSTSVRLGQLYVGPQKTTSDMPSAPSGLSMTTVNSKVSDYFNHYLQWPAVQGAVAYQVYNGTVFSGETHQLIFDAVTKNETKFCVKAVNAFGLVSTCTPVSVG